MTPARSKAPTSRGANRSSLAVPLFALLAATAAAVHGTQAAAAVFHSRTEIAELAFPNSDRIEARDIFLSPDQRDRIERTAGSPLAGDLITVYVGYTGARLDGYAVLDSHLVRTLPETLLIVLDGSGAVVATYVMAFHEPLDYLPGKRWLGLLEERRLSDDLRVGRSIVGITGATLSARAVVSGVRRALAIYEVLLASR